MAKKQKTIESLMTDLGASLIHKIEKLVDHIENPSEQVRQDLYELRMLSYRFHNMLDLMRPTQNNCLGMHEISLKQYTNKELAKTSEHDKQ